jgi:hypothetical protein
MEEIIKYPFAFSEDSQNPTVGNLELGPASPYPINAEGSGFYRPGKISLENGHSLEIVLYHNAATAKFMYIRNTQVEPNLLEIVGVDPQLAKGRKTVRLPGQLCLGAERADIVGESVTQMLKSPVFHPIFDEFKQENLAVFPIAREGLKYQVQDAIFKNYGFFCDEVVLDAHHVFDSSVPVYNRTVELTIFKDKDLDIRQKEKIAVAFFADSIASGLVMKEVIARVKERFENLKRIEVIAPLATIRGLCRLAQPEIDGNYAVRVHVFETLLNALPPDYYYSAHFNDPDFHFDPELEKEYREWWGKDEEGRAIADTACAGYGWSEAFYSPRKQIQMMNSQLVTRHNLSIADIVRRNLEK